MKFAVDKKDSYTIFSILDTKLNSLIAPELKTELILLDNEGNKNIILDMSKVDFIDSSGLSAILIGNRFEDGTLLLANVTDNVLRLIKISQLDTILNIVTNIQSAQDYIMQQEFKKALIGEDSNLTDTDNA